MEIIKEVLIHARADLPDQTHVRSYLADHADEYYGILHQRDAWTTLGPNGGGVLIRRQAGLPLLRVSTERVVRHPILLETQEIHAYTSGDDQPVEKNETTTTPSCIVVRAREMWLRNNLRIYIDIVDGCGIFLSIDAVVDDTYSERVCRDEVQRLLDELRIPESALTPRSYAEILSDTRKIAEESGDEIFEIRRKNFEELQKRMILLRPMPDDGDEPETEETAQ